MEILQSTFPKSSPSHRIVGTVSIGHFEHAYLGGRGVFGLKMRWITGLSVPFLSFWPIYRMRWIRCKHCWDIMGTVVLKAKSFWIGKTIPLHQRLQVYL